MSGWFDGDYTEIKENMSLLARLLDGDGYSRDTGAHGKRGYTGGDYRFNFIGAKVPLSPRAWKAMGHTGYRFVFHELKGSSSREDAKRQVFGQERTYKERSTRCRTVVSSFLRRLWENHGGYGNVAWGHTLSDASDEAADALTYLADVVRAGRAVIGDSGAVQKEDLKRITSMLYQVAQGHALIHGRKHVKMEDLLVCSRLALSTMPEKRRPLIRALLNPDNNGRLTSSEVDSIIGVSRPTAHKRMKTVESLGFGRVVENDDDDRKSKAVELRSEFKWPDSLEFPEF